MAEMVVGEQPSSGIGGIPTKYVIIGAGVLGVGALLLMQRGKSAPTAPGDVQPTGSTSAQLSSLQQMQLEQYGEITKMFRAQGEQFDTALGGLSTHLDSNAAALAASVGLTQQQITQLWNQTGSNQASLMQAIYQAFRRATDPTWMPGGTDDPWSPNYKAA